jgi:hypothetical protein
MSNSPSTTSTEAYEAPSLAVLGTVHNLTLTRGFGRGCWWDKQFGGTDGFTWMGIPVPVSDCSA